MATGFNFQGQKSKLDLNGSSDTLVRLVHAVLPKAMPLRGVPALR
jgi:hypothetical protein